MEDTGALPLLPLITPAASIRETMSIIDAHAKGIAILVDDELRLLATITDGDIRRALLAGLGVDEPATSLIPCYPGPNTKHPVTALIGTSEATLLLMMQDHSIRQIPLLDNIGRVRGLAVQHDLLRQSDLPVMGVIMAGGFGKRLKPLTNRLPKPMLPVHGRPLLEHMLTKLSHAGVRSVSLTTHYLGDNIAEHFRDGEWLGVHIRYIEESEPLGTAGSLSQMSSETLPLLVINGDILTGVDFRAMLDFHHEHRAKLTVGVRFYGIEVPFGVLDTEDIYVTGIAEKPVLHYLISAGIYIIDPSLCSLIPAGQHFDMPDLIQAAIAAGEAVISFPVREYWLDIGRMEQYEKAQVDVAGGIV